MALTRDKDPTPPTPIYGDWPECAVCTWTYDYVSGRFRLKFISRLCIQHGHLLGR